MHCGSGVSNENIFITNNLGTSSASSPALLLAEKGASSKKD